MSPTETDTETCTRLFDRREAEEKPHSVLLVCLCCGVCVVVSVESCVALCESVWLELPLSLVQYVEPESSLWVCSVIVRRSLASSGSGFPPGLGSEGSGEDGGLCGARSKGHSFYHQRTAQGQVLSSDHECFASPKSDPESGPESSPESSTESDPESGPESSPESSTESGPESGPESAPESSPESGPESGPESCHESCHESSPESCPESGPESGPESSPESSPESCHESCPESGPESGPESCHESCHESSPESCPESGPESGPESSPESSPESCHESCPESGPESCPSLAPFSSGFLFNLRSKQTSASVTNVTHTNAESRPSSSGERRVGGRTL
uniref:Uncharacterized protein n=1 Tax=Knipowitschia caucasica TaxID=637954 RepID=A0AAV2JH74_KNICA